MSFLTLCVCVAAMNMPAELEMPEAVGELMPIYQPPKMPYAE